MSSSPVLSPRNTSPSQSVDTRGAPTASSMRSQDSPPSHPPWRRQTNHLTPDRRPRSVSPMRPPSHPYGAPPADQKWSGEDPRSSSMQSLLPTESAGASRRTLLLIYIHGFMGNETSFKSFPAHVHNVLTVTLSESHVVHTKIYPRYRSRKPMEHARDDFSNWLTPHESPETDVVLLGHSLGGILGAEVAILQSYSSRNPEARLHRILGLVAFDTPFLGMHPGVITTGIGSLFRPKAEPHDRTGQNDLSTSVVGSPMSPTGSMGSSILSQVPDDPNYNPPFPNDVRTAQRKGVEKALYFINKHSDGLSKATKEYVTSHLEFGGCMADYPGLKRRYAAMRALEDVDELARRQDSQGRVQRRVRFVNYYSASTGRLKPPKSPVQTPARAPATEMRNMSLHVDGQSDGMRSGSITPSTPRLSVEEHRDDGDIIQKRLDDIDPKPMSDDDEGDPSPHTTLMSTDRDSGSGVPQLHHLTTQKIDESPSREVQKDDIEDDGLPSIPRLPPQPPEFKPSRYNDSDHLKIAQKDHARLVKAYDRAKKDREKSIHDRDKLVRKREKAAKKEADKIAKATAANQSIEEREKLKRSATLNPEVYDKQLARDAEERQSGASTEGDIQKIKKQRDRKFCTLPPKDRRTGLRDPTWIRVYMEGVDEVVAHTTLFIPEGETYERLVGDTADRIEGWIKEEQGVRAALASDGRW